MKVQRACRWVLLFTAAGCNGNSGPPAEVFESINAQVDHMSDQEGAHMQVIAGAASVDAVLTEEDVHRIHITREFDLIRAGIDRLSMCTVRISVPLDTSGFHAALQDVIAEENQHSSALRAASDVQGAVALEQRHANAMIDLVAYLRSQRDILATRAETADCP